MNVRIYYEMNIQNLHCHASFWKNPRSKTNQSFKIIRKKEWEQFKLIFRTISLALFFFSFQWTIRPAMVLEVFEYFT